MLCGESSLVNTHATGKVAIAMRCRAWTCPTCRPGRKRDLIKLAQRGAPNRLITLTVNPKIGVSPADRAARLARAWRVIVARAKRQLKLPTVDYLAVFEATKRGEPHLHILARCDFIPQRWLSEQARQVLGSPIVDIRQVKSVKHASLYIAKYVGKAPHRFATCKRYWHTRCWVDGSPPQEELPQWTTGRWEIVERSVHQLSIDWGCMIGMGWLTSDACWTGQHDPPWGSQAQPIAAAQGIRTSVAAGAAL